MLSFNQSNEILPHSLSSALQSLAMYPNSSTYTGANNTGQSNDLQYGQFPPQTAQQQAFGGMPQSGGFQVNPLQAQQTGFINTHASQGFPQSQTQPLQLQPGFGGYQQQRQPPLQQVPDISRTGQTSNQIAQSFQGSSPAQASAGQQSMTGVKIPKIRLSFLTAQDQAKFEQLFKSAVGDGQALSGKLIAL